MPTRYRTREKFVTLGNDYVIETAGGAPALGVDGRALRVRNSVEIQDMTGQPIYSVQERVMRRDETVTPGVVVQDPRVGTGPRVAPPPVGFTVSGSEACSESTRDVPRT